MKRPVDEILRFNRGLTRAFLANKLERLSASPFGFFRGTFHLFALDLTVGPFRKWRHVGARGPIVGDLHTENFGCFRAITNEIVYDINDFDETTIGPYEYDLRRLCTSLLLAALDNGRSLGDGVNAAERCARAYLETVARSGRLRKREEFAKPQDEKDVKKLLVHAGEKSRIEFMKTLAHESVPGSFAFRPSEQYLAVKDKVRRAARKALPFFLSHCASPPGAKPKKYTLQDVSFRIAGNGSLGRARYALLLGKGTKKEETWETLRLIEWKESLESGLVSREPRRPKKRAATVVRATEAFQLYPKRYLGFTAIDGLPVQAREIGANDLRFNHKEFHNYDHFLCAAAAFGDITARAHLLASLGKTGPRKAPVEGGDALVRRVLRFAVDYASEAIDGWEELLSRKEEIAKAWKTR